jgi:hypothetical protein
MCRSTLADVVRVTLIASLLSVAVHGCDTAPVSPPDFAAWPVNPSGYTVEELPVTLAATYARGNDVYFGMDDGGIRKVNDSDLSGPWIDLKSPLRNGAHMVFASSQGVVFASEMEGPVWRSGDNGQTWGTCLDVPVWRMDEDDAGGLYAGNYTRDDQHVATLYRSVDGGLTWTETYRNENNRHIHTVRWDDQGKRLYIAYGDSGVRGQSYSDDRGATWHVIAEGEREGDTDVAFTADYVIWASDDQSGRVFRVSRETGGTETLMGNSQFMWFAVTDRRQQIYVGTVTSAPEGGERAALLASSDQGTTWETLIETGVSSGAYDKAVASEPRELSAGGWLYCTAESKSYRIRRNPG